MYFNFDFRRYKAIRKIESEINKTAQHLSKPKKKWHAFKRSWNLQKSPSRSQRKQTKHMGKISPFSKENWSRSIGSETNARRSLKSQSQSQDRSGHLEEEKVSFLSYSTTEGFK